MKKQKKNLLSWLVRFFDDESVRSQPEFLQIDACLLHVAWKMKEHSVKHRN
jgi:hypothetical protein